MPIRASGNSMTTSSVSKPAGRQAPATAAARRARQRRNEHLLVILTALLLAVAWGVGYLNGGTQVAPLVPNVLPGAERVEERGGIFTAYAGDELVGYAAVGNGTGYSGPVDVLVGVNLEGEVVGVQVVEHKETPGFFRLLDRNRYLEQFLGAHYDDRMRIGQDLDGVSGATYSAEAVATGIREVTRSLASRQLDAVVPAEEEPIQFGLPEIVLVGLYVTGFFAHRSRHAAAKRWVRWATLITGMVVLGFVYNQPLTFANINSLLIGFWPDWRTNVYWYLLIGGILFVTSVQGKNPYCQWFCPFGAVQECMGQLTGAKMYRPRRWHTLLTWSQRGLALFALLVGLVFRRPGAVSYEPFGALFDFNGTWPVWALLVVVLLASLVVRRPWCNYLCPLAPVVEYIAAVRRWGKELWQARKTARSQTP